MGGSLQHTGLLHLGSEHRVLQADSELEGGRQGWKVRPHGRGSVRTVMSGQRRNSTQGGLRHHDWWCLPSKQAEGGKEEQEVEAKLRICGHSSDAPLQEDTGVDPVLWSHHSRLRCIEGRDSVSRSLTFYVFQSWCSWEHYSREFSF